MRTLGSAVEWDPPDGAELGFGLFFILLKKAALRSIRIMLVEERRGCFEGGLLSSGWGRGMERAWGHVTCCATLGMSLAHP